MERDFLGLESRNGSLTVKEATYDESKDSAILSSGMQWSFSSMGSPVPQFLSFKANQDDKLRKTSLDALASPGLIMTISTADASKSDQKPVSGIVQKKLMMGQHVGSQCAVTVQPVNQFDAHPVLALEAGIHPFSSQSDQTSHFVMSNSSLHSCLVSNGHNGVSSTIKTQPLGGFPQAAPVLSVLPPRGPVVGTTDLRYTSKPSTAPTQLTIFFGGSVCVYNDISPEKAQAIMLLAGNESRPTPNKTFSWSPLQSPVSIPSRGSDCFIINQPCSTSLPSPLSLTSHTGPQPVAVSSTINEPANATPVFSPASSVKRLELTKTISSVEAASTTMAPSVALPQARKASLARFLEKRKERSMVTSPYTLSKNSHDDNTPGSERVGFPANSFRPLPASN